MGIWGVKATMHVMQLSMYRMKVPKLEASVTASSVLGIFAMPSCVV